jgi:hypothetical protein
MAGSYCSTHSVIGRNPFVGPLPMLVPESPPV